MSAGYPQNGFYEIDGVAQPLQPMGLPGGVGYSFEISQSNCAVKVGGKLKFAFDWVPQNADDLPPPYVELRRSYVVDAIATTQNAGSTASVSGTLPPASALGYIFATNTAYRAYIRSGLVVEGSNHIDFEENTPLLVTASNNGNVYVKFIAGMVADAIDFKFEGDIVKSYNGADFSTMVGSIVKPKVQFGSGIGATATITVPDDAKAFSRYVPTTGETKVTPFPSGTPLISTPPDLVFTVPGNYVVECQIKTSDGTVDKSITVPISVRAPSYVIYSQNGPSRGSTINDIGAMGLKEISGIKYLGLFSQNPGSVGKRLWVYVTDHPLNAEIRSPDLPGSNGEAIIVQTATLHYKSIDINNVERMDPDVINEELGLDGYVPYGFDDSVTPPKPGLKVTTRQKGEDATVLQFSDTPRIPLTGLKSATVKGEFDIYLLYKPRSTGSYYVPLAVQSWSCDGTAEYIVSTTDPPGYYQLTSPLPGAMQNPLRKSSTHPEWEHQVNKRN